MSGSHTVPRAALGALLLVAGLGGCSSSPVPAEDPFGLQGSWRWISSTGGIAGDTRTPATEGFTERLELDADGTLRLFRNDTLAVQSTWTGASNPTPAGSAVRITFGEPSPFGFPFADAAITEEGRTLELVDPCCDGFVRRFQRVGG